MVPLLLLSCDFFRIHRNAMLTALAVTYGSLAVRAWLIWRGGNLFRSRRRVWLSLNAAAVLTPIAMWTGSIASSQPAGVQKPGMRCCSCFA